MPSDYTTAGGGLKLKGASKIDKKKKKKPRPNPTSSASSTSTQAHPSAAPSDSKPTSQSPGRALSPDTAAHALQDSGGRKKTEAEKRHEEYRRKRLEDKMKREGVKTHKEKVEELNKYLSGLSEHHDMPKIGPG